MKLTGHNAELFDALSRIAEKAYKNSHLLSCSVLSKAPNYGAILERYIKKTPLVFPSFLQQLLLFFRYIGVNLGHFCFLLMARFFWALHSGKSKDAYFIGKKSLVIIDIFALLPKIVTEKKVNDYYVLGLAEHAESLGHSSFYLYRLYGSRNPKTIYLAMKYMKSSGEGIPDICLLSFCDWWVLFFHMFSYIPAHRKLLYSVEKEIKAKKQKQEMLPEAYILQALYSTMGENIMAGELSRLAGKRLEEHLVEKDKHLAGEKKHLVEKDKHLVGEKKHLVGEKKHSIVSWYENQSINKAFYHGVTTSRKRHSEVTNSRKIYSEVGQFSTRYIGAQLLIWPEELLNNHPDDREIALGLVPDKVVVNGAWFLPEESKQEYAIGPALRYKNIFSFLQAQERARACCQWNQNAQQEEITLLENEQTSEPQGQGLELEEQDLLSQKQSFEPQEQTSEPQGQGSLSQKHNSRLEDQSSELQGNDLLSQKQSFEPQDQVSAPQGQGSLSQKHNSRLEDQSSELQGNDLLSQNQGSFSQEQTSKSQGKALLSQSNNSLSQEQISVPQDQSLGTQSLMTTIKPLLVLLSYHPEETKRVLQMVLSFAEKGYPLSYKFHPATNPQDYSEFLPNSPLFAEKDLSCALQTSSAVIGSGSGALVEAVAMGVPALAVEKKGELCLNYLPDFGKGILWENVEKDCDILPTLTRLLQQKEAEIYTHTVKKFIALLFAEPTKERIVSAFEL